MVKIIHAFISIISEFERMGVAWSYITLLSFTPHFYTIVFSLFINFKNPPS